MRKTYPSDITREQFDLIRHDKRINAKPNEKRPIFRTCELGHELGYRFSGLTKVFYAMKGTIPAARIAGSAQKQC